MEFTIAVPLLPDREEPFRRFWQVLEGDRREDLADATARLGLAVLRVCVVGMKRGSHAVATIKADSPAIVWRRFVLSADPFDRWVRETLELLVGVTFSVRFACDELLSTVEEVKREQAI